MENAPARLGKVEARIKLVTGDCIAAAAQLEFPPVIEQRRPLHPEIDLLLAACGAPSFDFADVAVSPPDWDLLLRLAERHRLLPALHQHLSRTEAAPASIRSAVNARYEKHTLRTLRFSAELIRVTRYFAQSNIPVLAHKGPALAQALYGDVAQRQFVDIDFLIRPQDVARARKALAQLSYDSRLRLSRRKEQEYLRSGYEYVFGLDSERSLLELQWQILPRFYSVDFDMNGLFSRAVDIDVESFPLRTPGKEDLVLVLCVHAAKHCWAQLAMLRDIAVLSRLDLDWEWTMAEARRLGIVRIMQVSFSLAQDLFGSPNPLTANPCEINKITSALRSRLTTGGEIDPGSMDYFRFMMKIRERRRDRLRFAWRLATTPSLADWEAVSIPDALGFLYRDVRVYRFGRRLLASRSAVRKADPS